MEVLGLDIGGTGIKGALVDTDSGEMLTERYRLLTPQPATPKTMIATTVEIMKHFDWQGPVGCGFPSAVKDGVVLTAANISKKWIGFNLEQALRDLAGCDVVVLNDADAAGLAEMRFGAGRGRDGVVLIITLGTGIGVALFVDGQLVPNEVELAPQGSEEDLAAIVACLQDEWKLLPETRSKFERALAFLETTPASREDGLLTPPERATFQQISERDDLYGRRAIALLALDEGTTQIEAGQRAGMSARQVRRWLSEFRHQRLGIFPRRILDEVQPGPAPQEPQPAPQEPPQPLPLDDLFERYRVDRTHARNVADHALVLFDHLALFHGLPLERRSLLETAALVHNVGLETDPDRHHIAGRDILLAHPPAGLDDRERLMVALIAFLHRKRITRKKLNKLAETSFANLDEPAQGEALAMAALVRTADGLDYSQTSSSRLGQVRQSDALVEVEVEGPRASMDAKRAQKKSDLWHLLFEVDLQFRPTPTEREEKGAPLPIEPVVAPGVAIYLAARQTELQHLLDTFPQVWARFHRPEFSQLVTSALTPLFASNYSLTSAKTREGENMTTEPEYIVLLGPPASGKGTQAAQLREALNLPHVASGDLFRENLKNETELGQKAKAYIDRGELVPDDITIAMVMDRLSQPDCADGALLDGFPRTIAQAEALDRALAAQGRKIGVVPNIAVPDEILVERVAGRRICRVCGETYHVKFNPPKQPGVCANDGGELYQRDDDRPETVRQRLKVYWEQTSPLIDYYRKQGVLVEINGDQSIDAVQADLRTAVADD